MYAMCMDMYINFVLPIAFIYITYNNILYLSRCQHERLIKFKKWEMRDDDKTLKKGAEHLE